MKNQGEKRSFKKKVQALLQMNSQLLQVVSERDKVIEQLKRQLAGGNLPALLAENTRIASELKEVMLRRPGSRQQGWSRVDYLQDELANARSRVAELQEERQTTAVKQVDSEESEDQRRDYIKLIAELRQQVRELREQNESLRAENQSLSSRESYFKKILAVVNRSVREGSQVESQLQVQHSQAQEQLASSRRQDIQHLSLSLDQLQMVE